MKHNQDLWHYGEDISARYLIEHGYVIVMRNFYTRMGEVDIIASKGDMLAFVEVKTRKDQRIGPPQLAITPKKLETITKVGTLFSRTFGYMHYKHRIDVIAIVVDQSRKISYFKHLVNVTR